MRRILSLLVMVGASSTIAAPKCPSVAEAAAAAGAPTGLDAKRTPPLPVSWPPSGTPAVRYFDFGSSALPTGIIAYSIASPSVEITVPLDGSAARRRQLKSTTLGRDEPRMDRSKLELDPASSVLLTVLCESRMPNEAEAAKLREGYGAWLKEQPLINAWLATNAGPFAAWVAAKPVPPPAPPGAKLTARLDGDVVVLTRDGKEVRFERSGLKDAQLTVVPLRADGNEPALWITAGQEGMLVRYASPPQVVYGLTHAGGQRGLFSTATSVWLMDVNGDGFNDVIQHKVTRSDVGMQGEGPEVLRYDPLLGSYTFDVALRKKAPWAHLSQDTRPEKLIRKALGVGSVELRGGLDLYSVKQPAPPPPESLGAMGSPPFVGVDVVYRVFTKKPGQKFGGHYHLAHVRYGKDPALVSMIDLGELGFPMNGCGDRMEEFRREGDAVVLVWPIDNSSLVEQRVRFDGKNLVKPEKAPVKVADCGL